MNTDVMFSSKTDLWATPQDFFDELNREFGFSLDVCAIPENTKCSRFFSPAENGLAQTWEGVCWCNPPYGREIGKWVKKAAEFASGGVRLFCFCLLALIRLGFTITYMVNLKFVLSVDGLNLAVQKTPLLFRAWSLFLGGSYAEGC